MTRSNGVCDFGLLACAIGVLVGVILEVPRLMVVSGAVGTVFGVAGILIPLWRRSND